MQDDDELLALVLAVQNAPEGMRERAFAALDRKVRPWAVSFLRKKGFSPEEVEDLTQEAMLRVYNGLKDFRRDSSFRVWFFEILTNVFRNELRFRHSAKREGVEVSLDAPAPLGGSAEPWVGDRELPDREEDPLALLLQREGLRRFRQALEELPAQMRRVCFLRYEHELKYREIASLLGISIETVKAHLHQAKRRLESRLRDDE